jgi:hypothetical protein
MICAAMGDEKWTDKMDRIGHAMWELLQVHSEVGHIRTEVYLGAEDDPQILSSDVAGGVLWVDEVAGDNRQVVLPDGQPARKAS